MNDEARKARAAAIEDKRKRLEELKARRARRETARAVQPQPRANLDEIIDGLLNTSAPASRTEQLEESPIPQTPVPETEESILEDLTVPDQDDSKLVTKVHSAPAAPIQPTRGVELFEFGTQTLEEDFPPEEEDDDPVDTTKPDENDGDESKFGDENTSNVEDKFVDIEAKILSTEEKQEEVEKTPFSSFLNTTSKKMERILGEPVLADLLVNFVGETDGIDDGSKSKQGLQDGSSYLSARQVFEHEKWTAGRTVTDMDWSPFHRELMLSSYDMPDSSISSSGGLLSAITPDVPLSSSLAPRSGELQSDGLTLVWNLAMPQRPEHIFTCGSPVLSARFHPTESPLVVGGCQSGQLVIWDIRAGRLPVQRSGQGYPLCAMQVTEKPTGLATASTDGKVSFWSLANLRDPAETIQVQGNLSCLAVSDANTVFCGDESGIVIHIPAKRKHVKRLANPKHFGMVTGVSVKKKFVLSTGVDWTVKLTKNEKVKWSVVNNSYDYMCDVKWSPVHSSLLATASSTGTVGLWNLANSTEEPTGEIVVESDVGLNKIGWSADGKRLLAAAGERVHVLSLSDDVIRQKEDDEDRMLNQLT